MAQRAERARLPAFNFVEYIGSLVSFIGVIILMIAGIQYVQSLPFELGLASLGIGLLLGVHITESDRLFRREPGFAPLGFLIASVLVLGGIGTLIIHFGPQFGIIELSSTTGEIRESARTGLRLGGVLLLAGFVLTAVGDHLRI